MFSHSHRAKGTWGNSVLLLLYLNPPNLSFPGSLISVGTIRQGTSYHSPFISLDGYWVSENFKIKQIPGIIHIQTKICPITSSKKVLLFLVTKITILFYLRAVAFPSKSFLLQVKCPRILGCSSKSNCYHSIRSSLSMSLSLWFFRV